MFSKEKKNTVFLLFLTLCVSNLHRFSFSFAALPIQEAFGLSSSAIGVCMSVYTLGIILMQIPGGMLADRYKGKTLLAVFLIAWSAFTVLTGFAWGFVSLLLIRFLFGGAYSMSMIASNKVVAQVFPRQERGKANSRVMISCPLMAAVTSLIVSALIASFGWRQMFMVIGAVGAVVFAILLVCFHPPVEEDNQNQSQKKIGMMQGLKILCRERVMWCSFFTGVCVNMVVWGSSSWAPAFFAGEYGMGTTAVGYVQFAAQACGILTTFIGGIFLDKYSLDKNRIIATLAVLLGGGSMMLMAMVNNSTLAMVFQGIAVGMITYVVLIPNIITLKKMPGALVGVAVGFNGIGQNLGSLAAPLAMGGLIDRFGSYRPAFILLAVILLVASVVVFSYPVKDESVIKI